MDNTMEYMTKVKLFEVIDEALLATYKSKPCYICKSRNKVHAHHHKKRSRQRLDVPENLTELCDYCHGYLDNKDAFIKFINEKFPELDGAKLYVFLNNPKIPIEEIYEKYKDKI